MSNQTGVVKEGGLRGYPNCVRSDFGHLTISRNVLRPDRRALQARERETVGKQYLFITSHPGQ